VTWCVRVSGYKINLVRLILILVTTRVATVAPLTQGAGRARLGRIGVIRGVAMLGRVVSAGSFMPVTWVRLARLATCMNLTGLFYIYQDLRNYLYRNIYVASTSQDKSCGTA
jgi:hypothetical protein